MDAGLALHLYSSPESHRSPRNLSLSKKCWFRHTQHLRPINRHYYGMPDLWWLRALLSSPQDDAPKITPAPWKFSKGKLLNTKEEK